jgi:HSP20 family protein
MVRDLTKQAVESKLYNLNNKIMTLVKVNNSPYHNSFTNLFDELVNEFPVLGPREWNKEGSTFPPVNIHETAQAFHLELNVPGRNKEDFKVNVENGLLTISFEKKEETKSDDYKTIRREFSYKSFKRSFTVDQKIDASNIQAKYENGVLKLLLPKKEESKVAVKQINID